MSLDDYDSDAPTSPSEEDPDTPKTPAPGHIMDFSHVTTEVKCPTPPPNRHSFHGIGEGINNPPVKHRGTPPPLIPPYKGGVGAGVPPQDMSELKDIPEATVEKGNESDGSDNALATETRLLFFATPTGHCSVCCWWLCFAVGVRRYQIF